MVGIKFWVGVGVGLGPQLGVVRVRIGLDIGVGSGFGLDWVEFGYGARDSSDYCDGCDGCGSDGEDSRGEKPPQRRPLMTIVCFHEEASRKSDDAAVLPPADATTVSVATARASMIMAIVYSIIRKIQYATPVNDLLFMARLELLCKTAFVPHYFQHKIGHTRVPPPQISVSNS